MTRYEFIITIPTKENIRLIVKTDLVLVKTNL